MAVNTSYLPKTNGLVFADRLQARSDKGRVFLAGTSYTELVVSTKASWDAANVYTLGQTIAGFSATFTGGDASTVYRSRAQYRRTEDDQWISGDWLVHGNESISVPVIITICGQIRFMTQARDETAGIYKAVDEARSFASVRTVPFLSFGNITATIDGVPYDPENSPTFEVNQGQTYQLEILTDGEAVPTYNWVKRGSFDATIVPNGNRCTVTANESGFFAVSCDLINPNVEFNADAMFSFIGLPN